MFLRSIVAATIGLLSTSRASPFLELDARQTVVVANQNVPESVELARHYMTARGIPEENLCILDLPTGETIARRQFEQRLRDPLLEFLRQAELIEQVKRDVETIGPHDSGWRTVRHRLRYLVSLYGVPLRIAETRPFFIPKLQRLLEEPFQRDEAAVDSELACLLWDSYEIKGFINNPVYNQLNVSRSDRQARPVLLAARLDGPTPGDVRRMIDDTLSVEPYGLHGRAYIDARSVRDPDYLLGDFWLFEAAERLRRHGLEISIDRSETLMPAAYPLADAAVYLGWYSEHVSGPFLQSDFRFRPGAVAYHLHSTSAKSLRQPGRYWAGPLIAAGAAAVMGSVNEPYLSFTPDLQIFADRLAGGYSFGESAYFAQRALSWQITVIGDPLYRPFPARTDDPLPLMQADNHADLGWAVVQRINRMMDARRLNPALDMARQMLLSTGSPVVAERIADAYAANELHTEAIAGYRKLLTEAATDADAIRIAWKLERALRAAGQTDATHAIVPALRAAWPASFRVSLLESSQP